MLSTALLATEYKLKLTIRTELMDYYPGFPVSAYIYLENYAYEFPAEAVKCLEPEYGYVEYIIKTPDGIEVPFIPWAYKEHPNPEVTLTAGAAIRSEAKLFFGANGWTFNQPGEYVLKAIYMKELESNEWPFSITTPETEGEKKLSRLLLDSKDVGYFLLFEGGDHLVEGKKILEEVTRTFPETSFAGYANFVLGVNLMQDFANFKENRLRKADLKRATEYLEKARPVIVSFHQSIYTHIYLEEIYRKQGMNDKADSIRKDFLTRVEKVMDERYHDFREYKDYMNDYLERRESNQGK
jgi:hypothetical protein